MSKNQEALDEIAEVLIQCGRTISAPGDTIMEDERELIILKELVDKATPKKPYNQMMTSYLEGANSNRTAIYQLSCRNCNSTFEENCDDLNCRYCGQAIDWSEDEPN